MNEDELRKIPAVDDLLDTVSFPEGVPETLRTYFVRDVLGSIRQRVKNGEECPSSETIQEQIQTRCRDLMNNRIQTVINATGVVLHTNLGRAPYPEEASRDMADVSAGYSNLEIDLAEGDRGGRGAYAEALLTDLTGAESAAIVNNCSAALVLALKALSEQRDVLISRGEMVQIGGGFRIPDILDVSGANLREVGTTNRTELGDFKSAMSEDTGLVLRVHRSNFDLTGFTDAPDVGQLKSLADEHGVPMVCDLGSGALVDTGNVGLKHERQPGEVIEAGADLVMFSGDKLLGGPQAGLIVGKEDHVRELKNHPLFRALRCDKSILASLETVLTKYATGDHHDLPVYRMFSAPRDQLRERGHQLVESIDDSGTISVEDMEGKVGGGALPSETIPSAGIAINTEEPEALMSRLRQSTPPVIGRIKNDRVLLNLRTVPPGRDDQLRGIIGQVIDRDS